jgi:hypothetical protein
MAVRPVFIVSDRTGITAETMSHSLLTQFPGIEFTTTALPFVDANDKVNEAIEQINAAGKRFGVRPLVFTTFVDDDLRASISRADGLVFDLFGTFLGPLEAELNHHSAHSVGRSHGVGDPARYTSRISAVNYAVHCDDGLNIGDYGRADVILVGVSRCGKTPTSIYLAIHFGLFCANFPLTGEDLEGNGLPAVLKAWKARLFGLTIDPVRLQQIRMERRRSGRYASLGQCRTEVRQAEALFRRHGIPFVDSSSSSIEELATTVIQRMSLHRRHY